MTDRNDSRFFRVILLAAVLLLCAAGCVRSESARPDGILVMLAETEGLHVTGENPVRAVNGADVSFRCELDSGYVVIDVPEGVTFDEKTNTVTVASPKYPRSVVLNVRRDPKQVRFFIENAGRGGRISADHKQGTLYEGTVITVQTELFDDVRFNGWSLNKTLSGGGRLVSDDLTYTFTLEENTTLYANYVSDTPSEQKENVRLILYNANGGQAKDGTPYYWQEADVTDFKSPNCLWDDGTFSRDGYVLLEYNTKADGSGEPYSLGSKVLLPKDPEETQVLFCIWAKESPASDFVTTGTNSLVITEYKGDDETVVIPLTIGGKKVTGIAFGAFKDKKFKTLVLTKNLQTVAAGAFSGCKSMETLYMFDTITSISDSTFDETPNWHNYILCMATAPRYPASREGCYRWKWERLTLAEKDRVIVVSGSSSFISLNTPLMEELLGGKYTVVNYGTIANTPVAFYLEFISHFTHEGDIVIHAPENHDYQYGRVDLVWRLYRDVECYNNVWRYIDIAHYEGIFSGFTEYNNTRMKMKARTFYEKNADLNMYGDFTRITPMNSPNKKGTYTITYSLDTMTEAGAVKMRRVYGMVEASGAAMYLSHAPQNYNALTAYARVRENQIAYMEDLKKKTGLVMISDIADCIFEGQYIYDDDFHLNDPGRTLNTQHIAADLIAQRKKEGKWSD